MKRTILLFVSLLALVSLVGVGISHAANVRSGQSPNVMANETINGTLYAGGGVIKVEGVVKGDLICAGQSLTVTGTIEGDVLCAAQDITISGHIEGNVRVAGETIAINGKVDGSVTTAGMITTTGKDATVGRDITVVGQEAAFGGSIMRDATVIASKFTSTAAISRDLDVTSPAVMLNDGTNVAGDFRYVSDNDVQLSNGAKVMGKTDHRVPDHESSRGVVPPAVYVTSILFGLASFFLLGCVLLIGTPRLVSAVTNQLKASPFGTLGAGLLGLLLPPFIAVFCMVTIVGLPLGVVLLLCWLVTLVTGLVFAAYRFGEAIMAKMNWHEHLQRISSLVVGLLILFILSVLPYVGGLIIFGATIWGIGGVWYAIIKSRSIKQDIAKEGVK